jgi:hypothetical protein
MNVLDAINDPRVFGQHFRSDSWRAWKVFLSVAAKPKSDLYKDTLAILNSGKADLLDNQRLIVQLCGLERHTARGGRDSIDHQPGPNWHDDVCNSWAGMVAELAIRGSGFDSSYNWVGGPDPNDPAPTWAEQRSLWQHPSFNLLRGPGLIRGGRTRGW